MLLVHRSLLVRIYESELQTKQIKLFVGRSVEKDIAQQLFIWIYPAIILEKFWGELLEAISGTYNGIVKTKFLRKEYVNDWDASLQHCNFTKKVKQF